MATIEILCVVVLPPDCATVWGKRIELSNGSRAVWLLYNTLFSRKDIFEKSKFEIFSREDIFANMLFTRKYLPAKISSRENIFPQIVSVPQI